MRTKASIASGIRDILQARCPGTFSLASGYGMENGQYVRFPVGVVEHQKRNQNGRCIYERLIYADGSRLTYEYFSAQERYVLTAKG
jgi:hypothetical protein